MIKEKKEPQRTCIACREMKAKREMLRIVKNADGKIFLDFSGKASGRGAYICGAESCIKRLSKQKLLHKAFSADVPVEVYAEIEEEFFAKR